MMIYIIYFMSCFYIVRICWGIYFRYQKIKREIISDCHKTHTICWSKFGVCWYIKWICLGICSICGLYVQSVGYLFNLWGICSICGSFVQYVAYLFNMWGICSICGLFVQYVGYLFNMWLNLMNIYFIKKLGCMTFIIISYFSKYH